MSKYFAVSVVSDPSDDVIIKNLKLSSSPLRKTGVDGRVCLAYILHYIGLK